MLEIPRNFTEYSIRNNKWICWAYYGINPNQIPDYKGLAGDTSWLDLKLS
nr:hypothetical protein [Mycoplasmopsis bovis]